MRITGGLVLATAAMAAMALATACGVGAGSSSSASVMCPGVAENSGSPAVPAGRSAQSTPEAALREALRNGVGSHAPARLPTSGWHRTAPHRGLAVFEHRAADGSPDEQIEVGRVATGGWFIAGFATCQ